MALRVSESEFYSNSVIGNQGQGPAAGVSTSVNEAKIHDMFENLLRSYEKAKVKLGELSLQASAGLTSGSNNLATILAGNPLWEAVNTPNGQAKPSVNPSDVKNLFSLIFKYMEANSDIGAKIQVAQAVNILAKQEVINASSKEGIDSMNATETQLAHIHHEQEEASSFWGDFLKIFVPVVMAVILVVTVVATVLTAGAAAPAIAGEVVAEAAIDGSVEAGVDVGAETMEMTSMAEVAPDAADATADGAETTSETTEESSSSTWQSIKNVVCSKPVGYGFAAEGIVGGFESSIPTEIEPYYANKYAGQASDAGAVAQASAVIQSAAVTNLQSEIQEDMSEVNLEQSIQQSTLSVGEQTLQTEARVLTLPA